MDDDINNNNTKKIESQVYIPNDNNCLFWAVVLAYLIPVKNDIPQFESRCKNLFGKENNSYDKSYLRKMISDYPQKKTFIDEFNSLITLFRARVLDYMKKNEDLKNNDDFKDFEEGFDKHVTEMEKNPDCRGGEKEIYAISKMLNCRIKIISENSVESVNEEKSPITLTLVHVNSNTKDASNYYQFKLPHSFIAHENDTTLNASKKDNFFDDWITKIGSITLPSFDLLKSQANFYLYIIEMNSFINNCISKIESITKPSFNLFESQTADTITRKKFSNLRRELKKAKDLNNYWNAFKKVFHLQKAIIQLMNIELAYFHQQNLTLFNIIDGNEHEKLDFLRECLTIHKNLDKILLKYIDDIFKEAFNTNDNEEEMNYLASIDQIHKRIIIDPKNISDSLQEEENIKNVPEYLNILRKFSLLSLLKTCQSKKGMEFIETFSSNLCAIDCSIQFKIVGDNKLGYFSLGAKKRVYEIILTTDISNFPKISSDQIIITQNNEDLFYKLYGQDVEKLLSISKQCSTDLINSFVEMNKSNNVQKILDYSKTDKILYNEILNCIFNTANARSDNNINGVHSLNELNSLIKETESKSFLDTNRGNLLLEFIFSVSPFEEKEYKEEEFEEPNLDFTKEMTSSTLNCLGGKGLEISLERLLDGQFCFDKTLKLFYNPAWIPFLHELIHGHQYMHGFSIWVTLDYSEIDWIHLWTSANEYQTVIAGLINESMLLKSFGFPKRYTHQSLYGDVIFLPLNLRKMGELKDIQYTIKEGAKDSARNLTDNYSDSENDNHSDDNDISNDDDNDSDNDNRCSLN